MTSTPPDASFSDSWVDLSGQMTSGPISPRRITPVPFGGEQDYLRMLREAQRESNRSSTKVSPISSAIMSLSSTCRNTPSASPKSPPNSPNPELVSFTEDLKGVYINKIREAESSHHTTNISGVSAADLMWDWSSRPNQMPPRDWKLPSTTARSRKSSSSSKLSIRNAKVGKKGLFSKEVMYTLVITNLLSLIIGAGIGIWLSKRSCKDIIEVGI